MHLASVAYANACYWEYATYILPSLKKKRPHSSKTALPTLLHRGKFPQLGYLETVAHISLTLAQWCKTDALLRICLLQESYSDSRSPDFHPRAAAVRIPEVEMMDKGVKLTVTLQCLPQCLPWASTGQRLLISSSVSQ